MNIHDACIKIRDELGCWDDNASHILYPKYSNLTSDLIFVKSLKCAKFPFIIGVHLYGHQFRVPYEHWCVLDKSDYEDYLKGLEHSQSSNEHVIHGVTLESTYWNGNKSYIKDGMIVIEKETGLERVVMTSQHPELLFIQISEREFKVVSIDDIRAKNDFDVFKEKVLFKMGISDTPSEEILCAIEASYKVTQEIKL